MHFFDEEAILKYETVQFYYIKTRLDNHIFRLTLNRPEKRNAFTPTMAAEIAFAIAYANYNSAVRCVIIDAEGSVFCAGADLYAFHDPSFDFLNTMLPEAKEEVRLGDVFKNCFKPLIAQVAGAVFAGGFLIVAGCHFVYSVPDAKFGLPEVKRGIWPMQVMASLEGIIAPKKILEMAITGATYNALAMKEMGLVSETVDADDLKDSVELLAGTVVANAPLAINRGIKAFASYKQVPAMDQHRFLQQQLAKILASEDSLEGIAAFKEKRVPQWKGK